MVVVVLNLKYFSFELPNLIANLSGKLTEIFPDFVEFTLKASLLVNSEVMCRNVILYELTCEFDNDNFNVLENILNCNFILIFIGLEFKDVRRRLFTLKTRFLKPTKVVYL